jgi:PIN domain nuclease of toxin-antitoxin system
VAALLLDTHIFVWIRTAPEILVAAERRALDSAAPRFISAISIWEIAILASRGRIAADERLFVLPQGLELLPVLPEHCKELLQLPHHHRDPFDRMLIAQARVEGLSLTTRDRAIAAYRSTGLSILPRGTR